MCTSRESSGHAKSRLAEPSHAGTSGASKISPGWPESLYPDQRRSQLLSSRTSGTLSGG